MRRIQYTFLLASVLFFSSVNAMADTGEDKLLNWQDTSISLLYGSGYEVDSSEQSTITLEHASDWSFGDMFIFLDGSKYKNSESWYGEATVRLSFAKLTDTEIHFSIFQQDLVIFKDILLATNYERGKDRDATEALLVGVGFDFDLSAFNLIGLDKLKYFQLNLYARDELRGQDSGFGNYQITAVTALPFEIGKAKFLADGYIDYVFGSGRKENNFHFNPQIKIDLGNFFANPGKLFLGVELDYWTNKYGIADSSAFDTDQFAASGIIKYHF